jgi:hypothetical protein
MSHPDEDGALVSKPRVANPFKKGRKEQRQVRQRYARKMRKEIRKDRKENNVA